jgi:hypothetical protein
MKLFRLRGIVKALLCVIPLYVVIQMSCMQYREVEKEMVWSCKLPEDRQAPGVQPFGVLTLELRYKGNLAYMDNLNGPTAEKLCQELAQSNKKTLRVRILVMGSDFHGMKGHRILSIDGKELVHQSGDGGSSASYGAGRPDPLFSIFRRYFRKQR